MLILKKQQSSLKLHPPLYADGIKKIKFRLLELHPEFECMINQTYLQFLTEVETAHHEEKSLIVESAHKNSLMILKDKKIFSDQITLTMNWSKILGAELTLREKDCKEFWNSQCLAKSKKLWFPTEIGCVDSHSSSSSGFSTKTVQNSWFSTKQSINPKVKTSQKMFSQLYTYSPVKKWDEDAIRVKKIRLLPTKEQETMLENWSNTTRYVYNKCLAKIKKDQTLNSSAGYKKLNKECITAKNNNIIKDGEIHNYDKFLYDWELDTPKDIRNGALRDIKKAYKTAWSNLKACNIKTFGLEFRKKKEYAEQSMEIPDNAIKVIKNNNKVRIVIYGKYMKNSILVDKKSIKGVDLNINRYTRLKKENNEWFLCVPCDTTGTISKAPIKTCALDPGVRKFQVIYSEDNVVSITPNMDKINKIYDTLDTFQSLRQKKKITQRTYDRKRCRTQTRLSNLVDDMHYKTIAFLTKNYTSILLPSFETQDMVKGMKLNPKTKRNMMNFCYYKFKQRLQHKCATIKNCDVTIVNEAYTSQTCGNCGNLKKTGDENITCNKCKKHFDRDINGARNIYIKYVKSF